MSFVKRRINDISNATFEEQIRDNKEYKNLWFNNHMEKNNLIFARKLQLIIHFQILGYDVETAYIAENKIPYNSGNKKLDLVIRVTPKHV